MCTVWFIKKTNWILEDTGISFKWATDVCVLSRRRFPLPAFWHRGQFRWISRAEDHQGSIQADPTGNTQKHSYASQTSCLEVHNAVWAKRRMSADFLTAWLDVEHFPADEPTLSKCDIDYISFSFFVFLLGLCGQASGREHLQHQQHCHPHVGA